MCCCIYLHVVLKYSGFSYTALSITVEMTVEDGLTQGACIQDVLTISIVFVFW